MSRIRNSYNTKPTLKSLTPVRDRLTFLYVEKCTVSRDNGAIAILDKRGQANVPSAALSVLMLGPGSDITHRAVELIADSGTFLLWVGERGVRYYAHGRPLTHTATLLIRQAELVSNSRKRLAVARKMYEMRFPGEDVSHYTMQQLRGREGARVRGVYRRWSKETGVPWSGREYDPENFDASDDINKALSAANICMYGLAHSVIAALGLSPGLGFVHTGHERSFVYDIADLYKADISIPIAFQITANHKGELEGEARRAVRDAFRSTDILGRMFRDICTLLNCGEQLDAPEVNLLRLWDEKSGGVDAGVSYYELEPDADREGEE